MKILSDGIVEKFKERLQGEALFSIRLVLVFAWEFIVQFSNFV